MQNCKRLLRGLDVAKATADREQLQVAWICWLMYWFLVGSQVMWSAAGPTQGWQHCAAMWFICEYICTKQRFTPFICKCYGSVESRLCLHFVAPFCGSALENGWITRVNNHSSVLWPLQFGCEKEFRVLLLLPPVSTPDCLPCAIHGLGWDVNLETPRYISDLSGMRCGLGNTPIHFWFVDLAISTK